MTPPRISPPWRGGRGPRRFAFTYADYGRLYGVTVQTIRKWVSAGRFDPGNLRSVLDLLAERRGILGSAKAANR